MTQLPVCICARFHGDESVCVRCAGLKQRLDLALVGDNRDLLPEDCEQAARVAQEAFDHMASFYPAADLRSVAVELVHGWVDDIEEARRDDDAELRRETEAA